MGAVPARGKRLMHVPHGHLEHTKVSFPDKLQQKQDQVSSEGSIQLLGISAFSQADLNLLTWISMLVCHLTLTDAAASCHTDTLLLQST
jgi:hypothetical protein